MTRRTLAQRVWPGIPSGPLCAGLLFTGLLCTGMLAPTAAHAACATPEAKINPTSLTMPDFRPVSGGGWVINTVTINGQPSKPNANQGGLFQWSFVGTPAGTLANANTSQVQFTPPDVTTSVQVTLRLTVTVAGCPGSDSEDIPITITNAHDVVVNAPPHAVPSASPASATEGTLVTLDGSASWDPDNATLSYTWTQIAGPAVTLAATASPAIKTFVAPDLPADTLLSFRLTVSDGSLSNSDVAHVNVSWTNNAPVAALSCPNGGFELNEGQSHSFDASASSDSDDGIASYAWQQLVGFPEIPGVATWNTPVVNFTAPQLGFGEDGYIPFKLTVTDHAGAKSSAECAIFIHDITRPAISVPADIQAEATSSAGANVGAGEGYVVSALDNVDGNLPVVNFSEYFVCEPPPGSLFALDAITPVLCRAWDSAGNEGNAGFSVHVVDTTAPTIDVPLSFAVEATGPDGAAAQYTATSHDAVDGDKDADCLPATGAVFPIASPGPTSTVKCNAKDAHGNEAQAQSFTIAVHDTTPPQFDPQSVSADLQAEATSPAGAPVDFALPEASDLVDLGNVAVTCTPAAQSVFPLGETDVHCEAVDSRNNSTQDKNLGVGFKVTIVDTTPPVLSGVPGDQTLEAVSAAGAPFSYASPTANDIVDGDRPVACTAEPLPTTPGVFPLGLTTVTCAAADTRGNSASSHFTVQVVDTTPPTLTLPGNIIAEATGPAGAAVAFSVSASDTVDASVTPSCSANSGDTLALGTTTVNCTATDDAGNSASGSFTVTVRDTTPPTLTLPANIIAEATGPSGTAVVFTASASDIADTSVMPSCSANSGSTFPLGTTTVNCTATDDSGNSASGSFTITVRDTTPPTLTLPANIVAEATGPSGAAVVFTTSASDIADTSVTPSCSANSGGTFPLGTTTVNCTATDDSGNSASGSFTVTVRDTTPPAIAAHAEVYAHATGNSAANVSYTLPTATDLVDGDVTVSCLPASGSSFNVGSTTVTCTAQDSRHNGASSTFQVKVGYQFGGFYQPIDNAPLLNSVKAGSAIPVKFSLGGNQGLNIFASAPASGIVACGATEGDAIEETVTAGSSSLQYDAGTGQYIYVWKTEKSWVGQCRILQVKLKDGASKTALFKFK